MNRHSLVLLFAPLLLLWYVPAQAGDSTEVQLCKTISDPGVTLLAIAAAAQPLLVDGRAGKDDALRTLDATACAIVVSSGLKRLVREPRPDGRGNDSFPSNHATLAFAAATMAADRAPDQAIYWYSAAGLIAYSRVRLNRHRPREVAAGALLGFLTARLEERMPRGILIMPFVDADGGCGITATCDF